MLSLLLLPLAAGIPFARGVVCEGFGLPFAAVVGTAAAEVADEEPTEASSFVELRVWLEVVVEAVAGGGKAERDALSMWSCWLPVGDAAASCGLWMAGADIGDPTVLPLGCGHCCWEGRDAGEMGMGEAAIAFLRFVAVLGTLRAGCMQRLVRRGVSVGREAREGEEVDDGGRSIVKFDGRR